MTRFSILILSILLGGLTGCSSVGQRNTSDIDRTIRLTATFVSPIDIKLKWRDSAHNAAGYVLEYANDPNAEYVPLGFFPPDETTFFHHRLIPETTFYYRVRPYYGPASKPVEVSLPASLTDAAYTTAYAYPEDYSWAVPMSVPENGKVEKSSIRNAATAAKGAPSDLKAELMTSTVSGFRLTWTDHANDEEGFFLERKLKGRSDFSVCALMEPRINAFGWAFEPPVRKGTFRIRAFYYGKPSNVVMKLTGKDPEFSK